MRGGQEICILAPAPLKQVTSPAELSAEKARFWEGSVVTTVTVPAGQARGGHGDYREGRKSQGWPSCSVILPGPLPVSRERLGWHWPVIAGGQEAAKTQETFFWGVPTCKATLPKGQGASS